ncbi:hypothetical protein BASA61_010197 [Batrachochytrium salamandrivorans]|nr:hypothetical protein BASA60_008288 [Batrachochytrium salamandrivorans]KAH6576395.1 hypothetical protein BASA62_001444 [Batrachochytrium salamandrivorans]KAH6579515.1 hypothetical protein BASA61_010197 [Batrachochytrium salamandrivorans]KAH9267665.1 hypothetical protein BASA84_000557 [Batrachochytrium salamandrivorans]KAH9267836.1 hypothetical protein BASA84_000525 [Batrachochytrium salamandrivorans]
MLKAHALGQLLAQATTGKVESTMLLHTDGSLLSFHGGSVLKAKTIATIVSNAWFAYDRHARLSPPTVVLGRHDYGLDTSQQRFESTPLSSGNIGTIARNPSLSDADEQQELIIECEGGILTIHTVSKRVLLCCLSDISCNLGLVRSKMRALLEPLQAAFANH